MKRLPDTLISVLLGLLVLLGWEAATQAWGMSALVLPAPTRIGQALVRGVSGSSALALGEAAIRLNKASGGGAPKSSAKSPYKSARARSSSD